MKLIHPLPELTGVLYQRSTLVCLLVAMFAFAPFHALACSMNGSRPVSTPAERFAEADLVLTGKIVAVDNKNFPFLDLRLEDLNMLKGRADGVVQARALSQIPCGESMGFLKAGQWWTFYLHQDKAKGSFFIGHVDAFCEKNAKPVPNGPPGTCSKVLDRAVELHRVRIDAGSTVSVGPERSVAAIQSATLQGRSSFAGVALPPGTAWFATLKEFDLPRRLTIGPAGMTGRVGLRYRPDTTRMGGTFYASLSHDHRGELTLHGAQVDMVRFTAPGWAPKEARLSRPGRMRGIHIEDYVTFTPDGNFATFRSGRDQVVHGVQVKQCDSVDLVDGRVVAGKFFNACAGR